MQSINPKPYKANAMPRAETVQPEAIQEERLTNNTTNICRQASQESNNTGVTENLRINRENSKQGTIIITNPSTINTRNRIKRAWRARLIGHDKIPTPGKAWPTNNKASNKKNGNNYYPWPQHANTKIELGADKNQLILAIKYNSRNICGNDERQQGSAHNCPKLNKQHAFRR